MMLKIPFFKQTSELNCGPSALKMVLSYFGEDIDIKILEERTGIKSGKGVSTVQIATASAISGYKTELYSKHLTFNQENLKLEFYQKYYDMQKEFDEMIEEAKKAGVILVEKTLALGEIIGRISESCVPIVLLDWSVVIDGSKGYQGHFVPVVGYDEENIYVHNHGFKNPREMLPIRRELFDRARKANGTDEDIIFIYRK